MRVAVIGVGGAGSAGCLRLAEAGCEVVGFEQFTLGHDRGSSHGETRIIRYTYPDLLYTEMMADAYPLWDDLQARSGENLFQRCGGLYIGAPGDPHIRDTRAALESTGTPYESLSPIQAGERFPAFRFASNETAVYQKESGFLRPEACVRAHAHLAREAGADIRENVQVTAIEQRGAEIVVRTIIREDQTISSNLTIRESLINSSEEVFDAVVVTAGAWLGKLFANLNLPLAVTRQQVAFFKVAQHAERFEPGTFPVWIDAGSNFYGIPNDGRTAGVKVASHDLGDVVDPNSLDRGVSEAYLAKCREYAVMRFPDLSAEVGYSHVCMYTSTPDEHFIIDQAPGMDSVWLVSGCSGHGFKFTALLGDIAASLVTGQGYARDLSRFSLSRLRESSSPPTGLSL